MILYDKQHQPKSISIEDVTSYLNGVIEASEKAARILYEAVKEELKKYDLKIRVDLEIRERSRVRNHNGVMRTGTYPLDGSPLEEGVYKGMRIGWTWHSITNEILPRSLSYKSYDSVTSNTASVTWDSGGFFQSVNWRGVSHFKMISPEIPSYPVIYNEGIGRYRMGFVSDNGCFHNAGFAGDITVLHRRIVGAKYELLGEASFWDVYDKASNQDKRILLRDWLPLSENQA